MKLTQKKLRQLITEELDAMSGGTGDVQSMLDKYSEEKVYSTRARARRGVSNSFMLFLKKVPPPPAEADVGQNRGYYDSLTSGSLRPTDQLLHKNKDGTLTWQEFADLVENQYIQAYFSMLDLHIEEEDNARALFDMLDFDGSDVHSIW